ncbi:putative mediator of RNA polymerase II transcription subunit 26 isoform X2 [Salvia hispanica]|uniref:putative mediator of RNA polymerase II transcription subunit 26 isoform X2 n=1 Tax=Salvia hispanica TaxID=49212 RepID=UPI002009229F|nr:putative mediator of RNA polymerase II transcription subunit 26 isoform X2 [Salvia hispanica]
MAPRTRKPVAKRRSNHVSRDEGGVEEHGQEQNEQEPELEVSQQPIQKRVMTRSTQSATASRTARSGILDKLQMMGNQQQLEPQVFPQASMEKGPRTRGATGNQSGYHRFEELDQMDGDGQLQNEEEHRNQETAPRSQRSTVSRRLNHDYLEEDEMDEYGQQDNEQYTNLEVTDALKNAFQILMASGSQRATTNQNHGAFQENHQRRENGNWKNRRQMRPPISEQASVMTPTTRKATGSHLEYHRLQDEIQMEVDGQHQYEEQPDLQMTRQVMTSSTRRSTGKRKINQRLLDRDEIEEHGQQGNEQPNMEYTQEVERALKILMAPSTRKAITNRTSRSGFRENNLIKENGQPENRKQLQPQNGHQASVMPSRTWKATTNQSGCHRLRDEDQIERHREHQNEEQSEFLTTQLTKDKQVMTRSTRRPTAGRRVFHELLDEDEIEEHRQRENKQASDVEVTQAIENALKILMEPSTRRATTNETSHHGFQDISQEASISAVMPPRSQNATRNQSGFHRLEDEDQMEGDEEQQNGESPEMQKAQQANNEKGIVFR